MSDVARSETLSTNAAPTPSGPYSQAVRAGDFVFLAGQTARTSEGPLSSDASVERHCLQALSNLAAVAEAAGGSLGDAVKITVYLADLAWKPEFDTVYAQVVPGAPARTTVRAEPPTGMVEVDAVLYLPTR